MEKKPYYKKNWNGKGKTNREPLTMNHEPASRPAPNENIVDTSGAGDWTTAAFLNEMSKAGLSTVGELTEDSVKQFLAKAQEKASQSCSYEGARGMMQE